MPGTVGPSVIKQRTVAQPTSTQAIHDASAKYDVPEWLLWGVYGIESDFGQNTNVSSAGAVGSFQFLPSTARGYGYPLVSQPNATQFAQQADGAAHYLHDLYAQYGDWDTALKHYSGGGYGLSEVKAKSNSGGAAAPSGGSLYDSTVGKVVNPIKDAGEAVGKFYALVTDVKTWIRVGEAIAGLVLVYLGLKTLTG